ncbi:hypothetical protein HNQ36_001798 [Afipia massiliensis]|uniref:Uncharacterized protein n=1 Tax=Afipia massiliensis TaxID=211460 RepID=A0A840MZK6_9BRAD|nr:hypothetical protein [Afipia massiliensis]
MADDKANETSFANDIAEGAQQARAFLLRDEKVAGRKLERGLVDQGNIGRPFGSCLPSRLQCGAQFCSSRRLTRRRRLGEGTFSK